MSPQPATAPAVNVPPIEFPKFSVGGEFFEARFTLASGLFLESRANIAFVKLSDWIDLQGRFGRVLTLVTTLTGAMLGHVQPVPGDPSKTKWIPTPMAAMDLASAVTTEEMAVICGLYLQVMEKVAAAVKESAAALATPPPQTLPVN